MSYINDALRKAQGERDSRYERFGGTIVLDPEAPARPRMRRLLTGAIAALLLLVAAVLLLAVYTARPSSPAGKGNRPSLPAIPTDLAATRAVIQPAVRPGTAPVSPRVDKAATPEGMAKTSPEAEAAYQEAISAQRRGDIKGAEALYRKALFLAPGHVQALNNLGVLYMGQKKRDRAISMFSRAIVLNRDYADPYYNMACLYAQAEEIDESLWYLKVAMTISGDVKKWVVKDADMRKVTESPAFKKIMEEQKN